MGPGESVEMGGQGDEGIEFPADIIDGWSRPCKVDERAGAGTKLGATSRGGKAGAELGAESGDGCNM